MGINGLKKGLKQMAESEGYAKVIIAALLGATLGMIVTYSTGVSANRTEIVRLATNVDNLTKTISSGMNDRYTGSDARRDFSLINQQIQNIREHDEDMETAVKEHIRDHKEGK